MKTQIALLTAAALVLALALDGRADEHEPPVTPSQPDGRATTTPGPMTAERMGELIRRIDPRARADRMRIVIPIATTEDIDEDQLMRLMQANFDSALDARYAIARDILWATFIHPLGSLTDEQFLVGVGQTANIVATYGTTYSSGMFVFGGGDSAEVERRKLIDRLKELEIET